MRGIFLAFHTTLNGILEKAEKKRSLIRSVKKRLYYSDQYQSCKDYGYPYNFGLETGLVKKDHAQHSAKRYADLPECGHVADIGYIVHRCQNKAVGQVDTDTGYSGGSLMVSDNLEEILSFFWTDRDKKTFP